MMGNPDGRNMNGGHAMRRWLLILGGVWGVLAIIYGGLAVQVRGKQSRLLSRGVGLVQAFTENAGLPLLEQDIKTLHSLLNEIGKKPQVLYASVVDHKNKIIAYTDPGQFFPERPKTTEKIEGIESWQDQDAMIFAGPINFSQTPIGEIRLALSMASATQSQKTFGIIVVITVALMVIVLFLTNGRRLIQWTALRWRKSQGDTGVKLMICPLCGQDTAQGAAFCRTWDVDRTPILKFAHGVAGRNSDRQLKLSDIGTDPGLAIVKERLIKQCADIISKLAVNDKCPR